MRLDGIYYGIFPQTIIKVASLPDLKECHSKHSMESCLLTSMCRFSHQTVLIRGTSPVGVRSFARLQDVQ